MIDLIRRVTMASFLMVAVAPAASAQSATVSGDPMVATIQLGARHARAMFTAAATMMSDADYAARPTPDVRSFGQLLAHVAESNFTFCATAMGAQPPAVDVERTATSRADIQRVLSESFDYCDRAFAAMNDEDAARVMRPFGRRQVPALAVLNFRNYHTMQHWGNAITYMRLRGKVPPAA